MTDTTSPLQRLRAVALRAGATLLDWDARRESLVVETKGASVDLVTGADRAVQDQVLAELAREFPGELVVGEEGDFPAHAWEEDVVWFVDPLDGTTNFVHGFPFYAVSLARCVAGTPQMGVVYAPALDELFAAERSGGATLERPQRGLDPRPISISNRTSIAESLLATGFPYQRGRRARLNLACTAQVLHHCRGIRRAGSAALDLCYVAAGRLDGFWESGLSPWDVAAGMVIAHEAGAEVSGLSGQDPLRQGRLLASVPAIHQEVHALLDAALADPEHWPLGEPFTGPTDWDIGE